MSKLMIIGAIASGVSAIQQVQAGRAQAAAYRSQAKQEELKGKQSELQYRQRGVETLRGVRQNISAVTARAAAGSMDPYSGSPLSLKNYAVKTGYDEYYLDQENAALALAIGEVNRDQNLAAAQQARRQGVMSAITTLGTTAMTMGAIGGAGSTASMSATGGAAIPGQVATTLPKGYGTIGAGVPSNIPAFPR